MKLRAPAATARAAAAGTTSVRLTAASTIQAAFRRYRLRRALLRYALQLVAKEGRDSRYSWERVKARAAGGWRTLMTTIGAARREREAERAGLVGSLAAAAAAPSPEDQVNALSRLLESASDPFSKGAFVREGAVPLLLGVARAPRSPQARIKALRALAELCRDCAPAALELAKEASLADLLAFVRGESDLEGHVAVFDLLAAASATRGVNLRWTFHEGLAEALVRSLNDPFHNNEFRAGAAACLRNCTRYRPTFEALERAGALRAVRDLCAHPHPDLSLIGLEALHNLSADLDACRMLAELGILRVLGPLLAEAGGAGRGPSYAALGRLARVPALHEHLLEWCPRLASACFSDEPEVRRGAGLALAALAASPAYREEVLADPQNGYALVPFTTEEFGEEAEAADRELHAAAVRALYPDRERELALRALTVWSGLASADARLVAEAEERADLERRMQETGRALPRIPPRMRWRRALRILKERKAAERLKRPLQLPPGAAPETARSPALTEREAAAPGSLRRFNKEPPASSSGRSTPTDARAARAAALGWGGAESPGGARALSPSPSFARSRLSQLQGSLRSSFKKPPAASSASPSPGLGPSRRDSSAAGAGAEAPRDPSVSAPPAPRPPASGDGAEPWASPAARRGGAAGEGGGGQPRKLSKSERAPPRRAAASEAGPAASGPEVAGASGETPPRRPSKSLAAAGGARKGTEARENPFVLNFFQELRLRAVAEGLVPRHGAPAAAAAAPSEDADVERPSAAPAPRSPPSPALPRPQPLRRRPWGRPRRPRRARAARVVRRPVPPRAGGGGGAARAPSTLQRWSGPPGQASLGHWSALSFLQAPSGPAPLAPAASAPPALAARPGPAAFDAIPWAIQAGPPRVLPMGPGEAEGAAGSGSGPPSPTFEYAATPLTMSVRAEEWSPGPSKAPTLAGRAPRAPRRPRRSPAASPRGRLRAPPRSDPALQARAAPPLPQFSAEALATRALGAPAPAGAPSPSSRPGPRPRLHPLLPPRRRPPRPGPRPGPAARPRRPTYPCPRRPGPGPGPGAARLLRRPAAAEHGGRHARAPAPRRALPLAPPARAAAAGSPRPPHAAPSLPALPNARPFSPVVAPEHLATPPRLRPRPPQPFGAYAVLRSAPVAPRPPAPPAQGPGEPAPPASAPRLEAGGASSSPLAVAQQRPSPVHRAGSGLVRRDPPGFFGASRIEGIKSRARDEYQLRRSEEVSAAPLSRRLTGPGR
eukprot:tig00000754_g3893.t1